MVPEEEPLTRLSEDWSPSEPEEAGAGGRDVFTEAETILDAPAVGEDEDEDGM